MCYKNHYVFSPKLKTLKLSPFLYLAHFALFQKYKILFLKPMPMKRIIKLSHPTPSSLTHWPTLAAVMWPGEGHVTLWRWLRVKSTILCVPRQSCETRHTTGVHNLPFIGPYWHQMGQLSDFFVSQNVPKTGLKKSQIYLSWRKCNPLWAQIW